MKVHDGEAVIELVDCFWLLLIAPGEEERVLDGLFPAVIDGAGDRVLGIL